MAEQAKRVCEVMSSDLETADGGGDGAYGLYSTKGSPEEVGQAIARELATCDILRGSRGRWLLDECGEELYLVVRIKVSKAE